MAPVRFSALPTYTNLTLILMISHLPGLLVAPVRFSVLLDDCVAWSSCWMDAPGQIEQCYCKVRGPGGLLALLLDGCPRAGGAVLLQGEECHG